MLYHLDSAEELQSDKILGTVKNTEEQITKVNREEKQKFILTRKRRRWRPVWLLRLPLE